MMAQANRIYILVIEVEFIFYFASPYFLKEIENMFSVFLLSCGGIGGGLGELEKAVETRARGSCFHCISFSPKLSRMLLWLNGDTVHIFHFFNIICCLGIGLKTQKLSND